MEKYWEIFLKKINSLLPYFVEFKEDGTMVTKESSSDCTVKDLNWRPIIIITYDKSQFFVNDSCQIL